MRAVSTAISRWTRPPVIATSAKRIMASRPTVWPRGNLDLSCCGFTKTTPPCCDCVSTYVRSQVAKPLSAGVLAQVIHQGLLDNVLVAHSVLEGVPAQPLVLGLRQPQRK